VSRKTHCKEEPRKIMPRMAKAMLVDEFFYKCNLLFIIKRVKTQKVISVLTKHRVQLQLEPLESGNAIP
jgi:hypothetical protein